jgi:hypothetical protein
LNYGGTDQCTDAEPGRPKGRHNGITDSGDGDAVIPNIWERIQMIWERIQMIQLNGAKWKTGDDLAASTGMNRKLLSEKPPPRIGLRRNGPRKGIPQPNRIPRENRLFPISILLDR